MPKPVFTKPTPTFNRRGEFKPLDGFGLDGLGSGGGFGNVPLPSAPPVDVGSPQLTPEEFASEGGYDLYRGRPQTPWGGPGRGDVVQLPPGAIENNPDYISYKDEYGQEKSKEEISNEYQKARAALGSQSEADIEEFMRQSPILQGRALGALNARGLGSSVASGGSGTGYLDELARSRAEGFTDMESLYQGLGNQLDLAEKGELIDLSGFYDQLSRARRENQIANKQNQAGPLDFLSLGTGLLSFL